MDLNTIGMIAELLGALGVVVAEFRRELERLLEHHHIPSYGPEGYYKQGLRASPPEET